MRHRIIEVMASRLCELCTDEDKGGALELCSSILDWHLECGEDINEIDDDFAREWVDDYLIEFGEPSS